MKSCAFSVRLNRIRFFKRLYKQDVKYAKILTEKKENGDNNDPEKEFAQMAQRNSNTFYAFENSSVVDRTDINRENEAEISSWISVTVRPEMNSKNDNSNEAIIFPCFAFSSAYVCLGIANREKS